MTARVLIAEDAPDVQLIVADLLRAYGHEVAVCDTGAEALRISAQEAFDLIVLDVMLPGADGFEVCKSLRERGFGGAILMLTARTHIDDRVRGLRSGADDYLIKPFAANELLARAEALLRRMERTPAPAPATSTGPFGFGDVVFDPSTRHVLRAGKPVRLAARELLLLRHLIENPGRVLSREALLARIWHDQPFIGPRTVDVHIAWLRQKLEENPQSPRYILTVRGEGYYFSPEIGQKALS